MMMAILVLSTKPQVEKWTVEVGLHNGTNEQMIGIGRLTIT